MTFSQNSLKSPFLAFRNREFVYYTLARLTFILGAMMQYTVVCWQVNEITRDPLSLGLLGLAEAIPFICVAPFAGHIADLYDRKKIILIATFFMMIASALLWHFTTAGSDLIVAHGAAPLYGVMVMIGIARGFIGPTYFALLPQIVGRENIPNAATWSSTVFHVSAVVGPAIAGLILAWGGMPLSYAVSFFTVGGPLIFISLIKSKGIPPKTIKETFLKGLSAGLNFVFKNQIVLSALSLDLFAVLFGGAVALLPIFATDVLGVGEQGYGFLRAAPALGAVVMAGILAYFPPKKHAGKVLLWAVAAFGLCMILFAVSEYYYLSLFLLALSGAFDNISVVVRHIILQLSTPDEMRGRVAAVNGIFIGSSNEIGAFESGVMARLMGLIPSVIFGGCMTIGIVGLSAKLAPKLRDLDMRNI